MPISCSECRPSRMLPPASITTDALTRVFGSSSLLRTCFGTTIICGQSLAGDGSVSAAVPDTALHFHFASVSTWKSEKLMPVDLCTALRPSRSAACVTLAPRQCRMLMLATTGIA